MKVSEIKLTTKQELSLMLNLRITTRKGLKKWIKKNKDKILAKQKQLIQEKAGE